MSIMVVAGKGAGVGVLIRSAEALERLEQVDTRVLDKTGTLTEGKPRVVAAGVLYPAAGVLLSPVIAALAMSFSSVSVIGNALLLRRLPL